MMYANGLGTQEHIGKLFGIRQNHVSRIVNNVRWNYEKANANGS